MVYVRWLKMMDKEGKKIALYCAYEVSKLKILGDSPQDLSWALSAPERYLALQSAI